MTIVRHVSQCSMLCYSFSFSHKCPGLVDASSRLQSDALCENAQLIAALHNGQVTTLVRYATRTVLAESCVSAGHQVKAFDGCQQTYFTTPSVSAAAGAPGTDAAADALAAVGVNCSSSSVLSACWLARCSTNRRLWLRQRACCLQVYVLILGVNAVDHTIPSNNTRITLNAYVCSCSTPSFYSP